MDYDDGEKSTAYDDEEPLEKGYDLDPDDAEIKEDPLGDSDYYDEDPDGRYT